MRASRDGIRYRESVDGTGCGESIAYDWYSEPFDCAGCAEFVACSKPAGRACERSRCKRY